jgi:large subunit ribosomal protein L17
MRHRNAVIKLGRTSAHRKATMINLMCALFLRKHIQTTLAKAKATRQAAEKLITLAKNDTQSARRLAFRKLQKKNIIKLLFEEIAPKFQNRPGGYTRVVKLGQRLGDGAPMAVVELVGYDTAVKKKKEKEKVKEEESKKKKKRKTKEEPAEEET